MKVLILANKSTGLYKFRGELLEALIKQKHEVYLSVPNGDFIAEMKKMGCHFIETAISRHGTNPFTDLALIQRYCSIIRSIHPDIVLTYTIKPNVYGGYACQLCKVPYIANVTGLGTAIESNVFLQKISLALYKAGLKKAKHVFFQNQGNQQFMLEHCAIKGQYSLLPGSGVNLERFAPLPYPAETDGIHFVFIGRIMREKGIDQYLDAAKSLQAKQGRLPLHFHICGFCEKEYQGELDELIAKGIVEYHGMVRDVREILKNIHCTVHPSFYPEGLSNVLLESCASARPIITTDRSGCKEVIDDGVNGFIVKQRDSADLLQKMEQFIALSHEQKTQMGLAGRAKVEREFDRKIVVEAYLKEMGNAR